MIIGHQKQLEFLKKIVEAKKMSHAYLFAGQEKLGKKKIALEWISQLFNHKQHPDLAIIEPEAKRTSFSSLPSVAKEIKIEQIRDFIWKLSLKPYSAPFKAAIIDKAHLMNQEAQTALLKTLEEPKGKTLLILITESPEYLLPTILSRCETIKFYPVKKEEIKNFLKKQEVSEEKAEEISQISLGRPGVAIDFISDSQKIKNFQKKLKELNTISNSDIIFRFQYAKSLSEDPQNLRETLDIWLSYFRNTLLSNLKSGNNQYPIAKLKNILKLIQNTSFLISNTNINSKLALERLMLEF